MSGDQAKTLKAPGKTPNMTGLTRCLFGLLATAICATALAASATAEPMRGGNAFHALRMAMSIEKDKKSPAASKVVETRDTDHSGDTAGILPGPKLELSAGGLRARLKFPGAGRKFSIGTPAFAEIMLINETGAKKAGAEILLETEIAKINFVSGKQVKSIDSDSGTIAKITGLRKGKARKILVELALQGHDQGENEAANTTNTLRITLRLTGGDGTVSDSTLVSWPVADCAGAFYSRIVSIREQNSPRMGPALKAAWRRDRQRPGRWLFKPPVSKSATKRVCSRSRRYWDPRRGRYRHRCTRYKTVRRAGVTGTKVTREEQRVFNFAAKWVRTRAIDPQLSSKRDFGWASQKVATDLRGYLKQDKHPAICTGVTEFVGYYIKRLSDFRKRAQLFTERLGTARKLAMARTAEAREAVKADPGGHPGWGALPLGVRAAANDRTLQDLVADLVVLGDGDPPLEEIRQAPNAFTALRKARKFVKDGGLGTLDKPAANAIRHALSLIEATDYIAAVAHHYTELDESIIGSLEAVQKAHGEHCNCAQ